MQRMAEAKNHRALQASFKCWWICWLGQLLQQSHFSVPGHQRQNCSRSANLRCFGRVRPEGSQGAQGITQWDIEADPRSIRTYWDSWKHQRWKQRDIQEVTLTRYSSSRQKHFRTARYCPKQRFPREQRQIRNAEEVRWPWRIVY